MLPHPELLTGLTQDLHAHLLLLLFLEASFVFFLALAWLEHLLGVWFSLFFSFWEDYYWLGGLFLLRGSVSASWRGLNDCRSADDLLTKQIIATYLSYFESLICSLTDTLDLFFNDYWCLQFFLFDDKLIVSFVHWLTDRLLSLLAEINLLVCSVNTGWLLFYLFFFWMIYLPSYSLTGSLG